MTNENHDRPAGWKNYEDFAAGIATNRLPATDELAGRHFLVIFQKGSVLDFTCLDEHTLRWSGRPHNGKEWYEAILVAPDVYFVDTTYTERRHEALTLVMNLRTRRVVGVRSTVRTPGTHAGEPRVGQEFQAGVLDGVSGPVGGPEPGPTRDLIGLRSFYIYSPEHVYEHIYLSSQRYAWQCLVGVQRGHGDVDLATTWRFDEGQYVFAFREFIIPVASVFFYNFADMRSTGKFIGVTASGDIENRPAGAFIQRASMTFYPRHAEPV